MMAQAKRGPLPARGDVLDFRRAVFVVAAIGPVDLRRSRGVRRTAALSWDEFLQLAGAENQHRHDEDDAHDDGGVRVALPGFVRALHHEQAQGD